MAREPRGGPDAGEIQDGSESSVQADVARDVDLCEGAMEMAWIDEQAKQLAKVEVEVIDDISIGGFLAKVYKGSHFMQERYELAPGLWLPTYSQYDFDGRRLFMNFSVHERTFYTQYKRIGPPKEAVDGNPCRVEQTCPYDRRPVDAEFL